MKDFVFVEKYRKIVNEAKLKGCENILCGDTLYYTLWPLNDNKLNLVQFLRNCSSIIKSTFFTRNEFVLNGKEPRTLFLFSSSYCREDLKKNFMKAANLVPNRLDMLSGGKRKFLGFGFIKYLFYVLSWNRTLKKQIPDLYLRFLIIYVIYVAFIDYKVYEKISKQHNLSITNLVSNCDTHAVDSFFTQKFNSENLLTVTLQHGAVCSTFNRWALEGIKSKYFICNNQFTIDEAKNTSFDKIIISAGNLSYIGIPQYSIPKFFKNKNIGIILDGEIMRENNYFVLKFFKKFFNNSDCGLFYKFHPTSKIETYKDYLPNNSKIFGKEINILDFAKKIDLAIVCNSTVLFELLQSYIPVFIIDTEKSKDFGIFKNTKYFRFSNEKELIEYLKLVETEEFLPMLKKMRNYFCTDGDTKENYMKIFKKIGILD